MKVIVDRFEGEYVVGEKPDRTMINIPKDNLPAGVKEGDILVLEGDTIKVHVNETAQRRKKIKNLMKDLWSS